MTSPQASTPPKRLRILDDEEIEALYGRPCFTADERSHYFALTQSEHDLVFAFGRVDVQIVCILQLVWWLPPSSATIKPIIRAATRSDCNVCPFDQTKYADGCPW